MASPPPLLLILIFGFSNMIVWIVFEDGVEQVVDNNVFDAPKVKILKQKMELLGISLDNSCLPGQYHNLFCPKVSFFQYYNPISAPSILYMLIFQLGF